MPEIQFTLNGKPSTAAAGTTIIEAAKANGVSIPHLCHAEYLKPSGACRLCVVEVEGARALMPSCTVKVTADMKIATHSERVMRARRLVLDLLLSAHPLDCMTCESAGKCKLQRYCYEMGIKETSFKNAKKYDYPVHEDNLFYTRDYNKCVLCGRCVRTCAEVQGDNIIDFAHRGFKTMISTPLNRTMKDSFCVFCGNCVASCPTGALIEKTPAALGREWELEKISTVCPYCGCGCRLNLNVKDGAVVKVTSSKNAPVNGIALCVKGRFGHSFINSPERLTKPLIKEKGKFREASWDEALGLISQQLSETKKASGRDSIGVLSSAKCTNEENYLAQKFARVVIGTNNVDHCARLCHASTVAGLANTLGSGAMTNSIAELEDAACIFAIGTNTTEAHPIIALRIKRAAAKGAKLIVANPKRIDLCLHASLWLRQRPGTDVPLVMGMIKYILDNSLENRNFINDRTENFDQLEKSLGKFDLKTVEGITGVPRKQIAEAARIYATSVTSSIIYSMGITQHSHGTENVFALSNLALVTGQIGRPSTGINPLRGQNNVQGACDMGALPNVYPGYQKVADPEIKKKFEDAWKVKLDDKIGLTVTEMFGEEGDGKIKALYIIGENPAMSEPDTGHAIKALEKLDFLVVQDIFLTETARLADVVLPAASFAEKEGTFTNTERRVQLLCKALDPVGESVPDWEAVCMLAKKMGATGFDFRSPEEIMNEIAKLTPSYGGMSFSRLAGAGLHWPCPTPTHPGTPTLHTEKFPRPNGKATFIALEYRPSEELPDKKYPLMLTTGRSLYQYHTATMSRKNAGLNSIRGEELVEINPADAASLGIGDGDTVEVASRRGKVVCRASVTDKVQAGIVFMTFHFVEANANTLTIAALDPIAKIPEFKVCAVRVEKTA